MSKCCSDERGLLRSMALRQPGRGGCACVTTSILRAHSLVSRLVEALFEKILDEVPSAVIFWFFLRPNEIGEIGHCPQALDQRFGWKRIELLDPHHFNAKVPCRVPR